MNNEFGNRLIVRATVQIRGYHAERSPALHHGAVGIVT